MGLFDWLTEGVGSSMGGSSMPDMGPSGPPPMGGDPMTAGGDTPNGPGLPGQDVSQLPQRDPPLTFQRPEFAQDRPMPPMPLGGDPMTAGGNVSNGPGLPPPPPPLPPGSDPMTAGGGMPNGPGLPRGLPPPPPSPPSPPTPTGPSALPPNATQTSGPGMPPGPLSLAPPGGAAAQANSVPGGGSFIGRALGLDANKEKTMFGSLGAGLTAAGNSKGKSKGQALFSGAGGALEGGTKSEDKAFDQRAKALQLANTAQANGDKAAYNRAMIDYYKEDLKHSTDKFTGKGMTDSQKYVQAQQRAAADGETRGAISMLNSGTISKDQFDAKMKEIKAGHLKSLGLDPNKAPPGTPPTKDDPGNPHRLMPGASQSDFDRDVQPGQAYINPKDGQVYIRKGPVPAAEAAPASEAAPATASGPSPDIVATGVDPEDTSSGV